MSTRWEVERAIFGSDLSPQARLMALTLLSMTDPKTCVVPAEYTPSLTRLEQMTGLSRSTVARELNALEKAGWVVRKRPDVVKARAEKERTRYRLAIPVASPTGGLARPDHTTMASPTETLASPTQGPELVPHRDRASPTVGLISDRSQTISQTSAEQVVAQATGATPSEAAAVAKRVESERAPRSLVGLLRRMAADGDLADLLTEHRAAEIKSRVAAEIAEARRGPECTHGVPGGEQPHPTSRQPLCPQCRARARWQTGVTA